MNREMLRCSVCYGCIRQDDMRRDDVGHRSNLLDRCMNRRQRRADPKSNASDSAKCRPMVFVMLFRHFPVAVASNLRVAAAFVVGLVLWLVWLLPFPVRKMKLEMNFEFEFNRK